MAHVMYHILMAAFIIIPILLIVFFVIARTSDGWQAFALDRKSFSLPVAGGCLVIAVVITIFKEWLT